MAECAFFIIFVEILFSHPSAAMGAPSCSPAHLQRRLPSPFHCHIDSTPSGFLGPIPLGTKSDIKIVFYNEKITPLILMLEPEPKVGKKLDNSQQTQATLK